jgi:hypothetical protein
MKISINNGEILKIFATCFNTFRNRTTLLPDRSLAGKILRVDELITTDSQGCEICRITNDRAGSDGQFSSAHQRQLRPGKLDVILLVLGAWASGRSRLHLPNPDNTCTWLLLYQRDSLLLI